MLVGVADPVGEGGWVAVRLGGGVALGVDATGVADVVAGDGADVVTAGGAAVGVEVTAAVRSPPPQLVAMLASAVTKRASPYLNASGLLLRWGFIMLTTCRQRVRCRAWASGPAAASLGELPS